MASMTPQQMAGYVSSQQSRLNTAIQNKDKGLQARLLADAKNKGYTLSNAGAKPVQPVLSWQPPTKNTNTQNNTSTGSNAGYTGSNTMTFGTRSSMNQSNTGPVSMVTKQPVTQTTQTDSNNNKQDSSNTITLGNITNKDSAYNFVNPDMLKSGSFNYDFTQDPIYLQALQSALNTSGMQTKKDQQQALEALNERGISNSSITQNQFQQIANENDQRARDSVLNNLVPQLIQQAYGRFQDQRDYNLNKAIQEAGLLGTYNGKEILSKTNSDRQFALDQSGVTGMYNGNPTIASKNADRSYNLSLGEALGMIDGKPTIESKKYSADMAQLKRDNEMKDKNYQLNVRSQNWAENPDNPLNQSREATAQSKGIQDKTDYIAKQKSDYLTGLQNEDMTYEEVMNSININELSGNFDSQDPKENKRIADEIRATVNSFVKNNTKPETQKPMDYNINMNIPTPTPPGTKKAIVATPSPSPKPKK